MLKTTRLSDKLAPSKINSSKSASNKNNNNRLVSEKNNKNNEVDGFNIGENDVEYAKKLRKLSKSGKLKSEKTSKF